MAMALVKLVSLILVVPVAQCLANLHDNDKCPPSCEWQDTKQCCGIWDENIGKCYCPPSLVFSAGFSSDMVLQRAPAKSAVYGVAFRTDAVIDVQIQDEAGLNYNVSATVQPLLKVDHGPAGANYTAQWKAFLRPASAGGVYTITARCLKKCGSDSDVKRNTALIERATFGDIYFCSGQSNMALSLRYTFSAKELQASIAEKGRYKNLRLMMFGGMNDAYGGDMPVWATRKGAKTFLNVTSFWFNASFAATPGTKTNFLQRFSATCLEFGRELTDALGSDAPPIGLIQSAVGGSPISCWMPNKTVAKCWPNKTHELSGDFNESLGSAPNDCTFYNGMVCPFQNMTVRGFLWYQGENDMARDPGSYLRGVGYGCLLPALVNTWRSMWSVENGTTPLLAPFGVVSIAPGGSEGAGYHMAAFRWSQTANYGVLPNPAMPHTFMAHAYDLGDPWGNDAGDGKCVANKSIPKACTKCCNCGDPSLYGPKCKFDETLSQWNDDLRPLAPLVRDDTATPFYEGPVHPRLKRPVGRRAAQALKALEFEGKGPVTGPTISGCRYDNTTSSITVFFNRTLLAGDKVVITSTQDINYDLEFGSTTMVCTGTAKDCGCLSWNYAKCEVPADGGAPRNMEPNKANWTFVPVSVGKDNTLAVNLAGFNLTNNDVHAIKFGWNYKHGHCCESLDAKHKNEPCIPGSCGIMTKKSLLPVNPFFAQISDGKCSCTPPQTCDE